MKNTYPLAKFHQFHCCKDFILYFTEVLTELVHMCYINAFEALVNHSRMSYLSAHMELTAALQTCFVH